MSTQLEHANLCVLDIDGMIKFLQTALTDQDDPSHHGIIGDILSPSQTIIAVKKIINWLTQI